MSCKYKRTGESSLELQPGGTPTSTTATTTTTTATDNQDSKQCLLQSDGSSQSSVEIQYSYAYGHMGDPSRNQHSNSRPSSVPPFNAPDPPDQASQSLGLIPPSPLSSPSGSNEYLEPKGRNLTEQSAADTFQASYETHEYEIVAPSHLRCSHSHTHLAHLG